MGNFCANPLKPLPEPAKPACMRGLARLWRLAAPAKHPLSLRRVCTPVHTSGRWSSGRGDRWQCSKLWQRL